MTSTSRTRLGILLFIPLAALLLATFACLPVPVGDPETSKMDDQLNGAWQGVAKNKDDKSTALVMMRPWDAHTYLMQYTTVGMKDGKEENHLAIFKAWLTTIGNATFITCQPMSDLKPVVGEDVNEKPSWAVLRLEKTATGMDARLIDPSSDLLKELDKEKITREQVEAVIKNHVDDKTLYGETISFKKLSKENRQLIEDTLKKFNISNP